MIPAVPVELSDAALTADVVDGLALVEKGLREAASTPNEMLAGAAQHLINAGGKRLRPMLTLAAAAAVDARAEAGAVAVGVVPAAAQRLAPTGKRILLIERGDYLPRSRANWDSQTVFVDGSGGRDLVRQGWRELSSRPALLCRRQFKGLWRGALSLACTRLRPGRSCR